MCLKSEKILHFSQLSGRLQKYSAEESESMRVITGACRGRRLISPTGDDVRPTTDNVKESVFSIIQFSVEGRSFLDAFAGSGQMGIEALSRGAASAVFVDNSRRSLEVVRKNLDLTGLQSRAEVICADTVAFLSSCRKRFDIAFLDPPYSQGLLQDALRVLPAVMNEGGYIICEHPAEEVLPQKAGNFIIKKSYRYGKIMITVYSGENVEGL